MDGHAVGHSPPHIISAGWICSNLSRIWAEAAPLMASTSKASFFMIFLPECHDESLIEGAPALTRGWIEADRVCSVASEAGSSNDWRR